MTEQEIASFLTPAEVAVYSRLLSRPDARLPVSVFATIAELRKERDGLAAALDTRDERRSDLPWGSP